MELVFILHTTKYALFIIMAVFVTLTNILINQFISWTVMQKYYYIIYTLF